MDDLGSSIKLSCPKCKKDFQKPLSELHFDINPRCPNCGYHVAVRDGVTDAIVSELFKDWERNEGKLPSEPK